MLNILPLELVKKVLLKRAQLNCTPIGKRLSEVKLEGREEQTRESKNSLDRF